MNPVFSFLITRSAVQTDSLKRILIPLIILATVMVQPLRADEDAPIAYWGFGNEESTRLESHGGVHRDVAGPRPKEYPGFSANNTAVQLDGQGARFTFDDPGTDSQFDFTNDDEITIEAWVNVNKINEGDNVYVIGKGRTGNPGFNKDNQNWALRIRMLEGRARISLLFSSVPPETGKTSSDSNWHRWTSSQGFSRGKEWHHIALGYKFGDPESILGVIDGKQVQGTWDAGGPTRNKPTTDNDAIWIGSALGGSPSNSFRGGLDELSVYRKLLAVDTLKSRYQGPNQPLSAGPRPAVMPELGALPENAVQLTFHEGMPSESRWLNDNETDPQETLKWQTNAFLLDQFPQRYDDWGIRAYWNGPVLVRMAADIPLSAGKHNFLMRVRGMSRLWVDGNLIAQSKPVRRAQNGFEAITPPAPAPKPGLRIAEHRQQERFGEYTAQEAGKYRVVLETLVGGRNYRTDPGETCVAMETADGNSYALLQPDSRQQLHLTDPIVTSLLVQQKTERLNFDDRRRRAAAQSQSEFWNQRHDLARLWAKQHPAPGSPDRFKDLHPIDAFLKFKSQSALEASSKTPLHEARMFHDNVQSILREHCFRCHGEKAQGGLRLTSLKGALTGGDSEVPGIQPGDADKSEIITRILAESPDERMPPGKEGLSTDQITTLKNWINDGARWPAPPVTPDEVSTHPLISDTDFIRRVFLDTVGVIPSDDDVRDFLQDRSTDKRTHLIQRLLADHRWADHWTSYWQDLLAENPTLINASLNTTGPFRWYIYDSFRDNKPFDRFVTELILLRGSAHEGGSAGFGIAANNDAPFAAKGQIVANAFLGIELQCARCHDSPYHETTQQDLYALAAMFQKKQVTVPPGNRVPDEFFAKQKRNSLIEVTLKPGEPVKPIWPFAKVTGSSDDSSLVSLMHDPEDPREKLAALITSPRNQRFAEVIVNRVWKRLIGTGIVEPPDDWEGQTPSHPRLLKWLAQDFIVHGYDLKHLTRLILTSDVYQREAVRYSVAISPEKQFFVAPNHRRMSAEQVIDSLHVAVGKSMNVEEVTFAPEAGDRSDRRLTLGVPERAWMFASLGNERDRPSLSLPRARAMADIMEAFGWNGARQNPRTDRDIDPNVLQPGVLQNSNASILLTRASVQSGLANAAVSASSPEQLVDTLFLKILSRLPQENERAPLVSLLSDGFQERVLPEAEQKAITPDKPLPVVTWSNHVQPESNSIALEMEKRARAGNPPDPRLRTEWREIYEDVVWSLVNVSEFVWIP